MRCLHLRLPVPLAPGNAGGRKTSRRHSGESRVERNGSGVELQTLDYENPPGFESCAAVLKPWASLFTLHCASSLGCINEYLATDSGGYLYKQPFTH